MKTLIIICTLLIVFNGTFTAFVAEDLKPAIKTYAQEFAQWL
jgi:hypothetical protein